MELNPNSKYISDTTANCPPYGEKNILKEFNEGIMNADLTINNPRYSSDASPYEIKFQ